MGCCAAWRSIYRKRIVVVLVLMVVERLRPGVRNALETGWQTDETTSYNRIHSPINIINNNNIEIKQINKIKNKRE